MVIDSQVHTFPIIYVCELPSSTQDSWRLIKSLPFLCVPLDRQCWHTRIVRCGMRAAARVLAIRMRLYWRRAARCCFDSFALSSAFRLRSASRSKAPCSWDCLRSLLRSRLAFRLASVSPGDSLDRANLFLVAKVSRFFGGIVNYAVVC